MEDKIIMNTALTLVKNGCELLMHGAIESNTPKIKKQFEQALQDFLVEQGAIFSEMEAGGLYNIENTTEAKITKTKNKYAETL